MYRNIVTKTLIATHCCKNIIIVRPTEHWHNIIKKRHSSNNTADKGLRNKITTDTFKQLVGKTEKVSFSSGSESRDTIRRADLLRKSVPSRRGGVCERYLTIGYGTDRWTTEDRVVRTWAKLTGSGVNGKKVREVGRRVSWHRVVANTCKFVLDAYSMKWGKMRGNMLTFGNPEDKTSCIVLNLLKTENQRSGAAGEERVTVVKTWEDESRDQCSSIFSS